MVLFESMAAGVSIVAVRVGGVPDVLDDRGAWLVATEDPIALVSAIRTARSAPDERSRQATPAAERLATGFGGRARVQSCSDHYTRVGRERRPR